MRFTSIVRYAVSDLRHRPGASALNVAAVALAAGYVLVLGFYGASIHRYQGDLLERTLPTKIAASVPDVTDAGLRFTEQRMAALAAEPDVALAFPRIELNVEVSLDGARAMSIPAEGTVPGDPALAPERLAWGRGASAPDAAEVVLSQALLGRLGGLLGDGPSPGRLALRVARTVGGREEVQRIELAIVGVLENASADTVHVPVEQLTQLDLWCTNKIDGLESGAGERRRARYDSAVAYGPPGGEERVAQEASGLEVVATPGGEVEVLEARGPLWSVVERVDGAPLEAEDEVTARAVLAGRSLHGVRVLNHGGARVLTLPVTDPRWELLPSAARAGTRTLVGAEAGAAALAPLHAGPVAAAPAVFPVDADLCADEETVRRLAFDPERCDGAERFTLVETRDPAAGAALAGLRDAAPEVGAELGWAFYKRPVIDPFAGALEVGAAAANVPGLATGVFVDGFFHARVEGEARERRFRLRVLPIELFRQLAPELDTAGPAGTCVLVTRDPARAPARLLLGREQLLVARVLAREVSEDQVWTTRPEDLAEDGALARMSGVVAWGPWPAVARLDARDDELSWPREIETSSLPRSYAVLLDGDAQRAAESLPGEDPGAYALTELVGVRARAGEEGLVLVAASKTPLALQPGTAALRSARHATGEPLALATARWRSSALVAAPQAVFPPRLCVVPETVFREAAYESSTRAATPPGEARLDLHVEDPLDLLAAERDLAPHGLALRPLTPVERRALLRWEVSDPRSDDGRVGADLVAVLGMSQPTFVAARPELRLEARIEGVDADVALFASAAADPDRFAQLPLQGTWLRRAKGPDQIVLPLGVLGEDADPAAAIGRTVQARFGRVLYGTSEEGLTVPLEVVGLVEGERAFVPAELLADVQEWRAGKLVFNDTRGTFESPVEVALRGGHLRANVFAANPDAVAGVVAALQGGGYHTEDRLAEQQGLRRLGRILVFVVGFFVLGCVVNASITVLVATMMNIKSKIFEIGILRAHGVKVREVVGIFASQGLAIGALAFAAAALLVALGEPLLRGPVRQAFGLDSGEVLVGSPFDGQLWWLGATALAVSIVFSFGGVVVPAVFACRLSPVEALRRRE